MLLESPKVTLNKSEEETFDFLSNVGNFEKLMPETIEKFEVLSEERFLFSLKGMPEIILEKKEEIRPNQIILGAAGGKIDFSLIISIAEVKLDEINLDQTEVSLTFKGDFNPMMAMMIKNPIKKFIETLAVNLPKAV